MKTSLSYWCLNNYSLNLNGIIQYPCLGSRCFYILQCCELHCSRISSMFIFKIYSKYILCILLRFFFLFCYDSTIICGHILRQDYDWIFHTKSLQTFQKRINQYQLLLCEVKQHRCLNSENHRIKTKLFIHMVLRTDLQKHINL
jgi:hypothetical protein